VEDPTRQHLEAALRQTASYFRGGQFFIGSVGLFVIVGGVVREIYWLSLIGLVFFGGLVALMVHSQHRTQNHPLRRTILEQPERITSISYRMASSSSGAFPTHWLTFGDESGQSLGLQFDEGVIHALAPFLARRFVNAKIQIPGFDPRRDVAQA
jgi:hypothetical protein